MPRYAKVCAVLFMHMGGLCPWLQEDLPLWFMLELGQLLKQASAASTAAAAGSSSLARPAAGAGAAQPGADAQARPSLLQPPQPWAALAGIPGCRPPEGADGPPFR